MRCTKVVIFRDHIKNNILQVKKNLQKNTKICIAVKADGYGCGAIETAKIAEEENIDYLAIATISEGIELRNNNIKSKLLLLSLCTPSEFQDLIDYDITPVVFDLEFIQELKKCVQKNNKSNFEVFLAIDTGMGRIGCFPNEAAPLAKEIIEQNILKLAGTITHFAVSDSITTENQEFTKKQYNDFVQAIENIKKEGINPGIKTCSSSAALFAFPEMQMDMVRPGIVIYGYYPDEITKDFLKNKGIDVDLKPVMQLETSVVAIKKITKGTSISYGRTWIAQNDTTIAVLPIGYADGLLRRNSPGLKVSINGKEYPVCGRICMDQCMVDLGLNNTEVKRWDKVIIFGPKNNEALQDANDIAVMTNTIPYEIMTSICAKRVQKYFV